MKVLFICTGNTCRSPMAEGLMKMIASKRGINMKVQSAGIFAADGAPATAQAIAAAEEYGADIAAHRSQNLTREMIQESDLILTMTASHKQMLDGIRPDKVYTLGEYAGTGEDVEDPYGGDSAVYHHVCSQIYELLIKIMDKLSEAKS